jgi:hypothetical protein
LDTIENFVSYEIATLLNDPEIFLEFLKKKKEKFFFIGRGIRSINGYLKFLDKADIDDITQVVQSLFCPNDRNHFIRLLKKSCEEFKVEQRDENFLPVKSALTGLKAKFLERFNFLREACQHWERRKQYPI